MKVTGNGFIMTYEVIDAGVRLERLSGNGVDLDLNLTIPVRPRAIAAVLGARGGSATAGVTSKLKAKTSAANGKLGGRPKGSGKKSF